MDNIMVYLTYILFGGLSVLLMGYLFYLAFRKKREPETPMNITERTPKKTDKAA